LKNWLEMREQSSKKSGLIFHKISRFQLRVNKYAPLRGLGFIPLPIDIAKKKAVINVQNNDSESFKYAILSKYVNKNAYLTASYKNIDHRYNFNCITFPTPLSPVPKFEKVNKISINIFGLNDDNKVYPIRICEDELKDHRDLFFL
jgi:hypothetical protein